ncbi:DUF6895 family protein [Streptomyces sp. NPDC003027]
MAHYLRQWLPVWVDIWLEVGQYDLVGELLAVDACIGDPVYGPEPWQQLAAVQHPTGSPPPPRDSDPIPADEHTAFKDNHHPGPHARRRHRCMTASDLTSLVEAAPSASAVTLAVARAGRRR